jgi:hypothetical protein
MHMATEIQSLPVFPKQKGAAVRWRRFCEQWRHSYLLIAAVFFVIWRVSAWPIPKLENTRIMGGRHPLDVLTLMDMLKLMWVFPLVSVVLYAASFLVRKLNTPAAIAVSALSSAVLIAFVLICALVTFSLWAP